MKSRLLSVIVIFFALNASGCYYSHLASGQLKLLWRRQPIAEAAVDPAYPKQVRDLLGLVESIRSFGRELGLRVDDQYTSFVDWPGDRVVTTLVRTRPGSLEAVPNWFPIVGSLPYKGYFDREWAEAEATRLREDEGFDVCVSAISAYSTLGWFADPITTPMLERGTASLVETVLHELVHATAFLRDEADFNESVAQFIGQRAAIQFFERRRAEGFLDLPDPETVRDAIADRDAMSEVILGFRSQVILIEDVPDRVRRRSEIEVDTREKLAALPLRVYDPRTVANNARLSNACLALRGTYLDDGPRHAEVLAALDGDLSSMIARLAHWAKTKRSAEEFYDMNQSVVVTRTR
jgi:predicted aminopeptidase